jgi:hypothetical protein
LTFLSLDSAGLNSGKEPTAMTSNADQLERDILRVFRCARRQDRPDIAEFMLAALEKLDSERANSPASTRPLIDAYRDLTGTCHSGKS